MFQGGREYAFRELLTKMANAWLGPLRNVDEAFDMPSPIRTLNTLRAADVARPSLHRRLLWNVVHNLEAAIVSNPRLWEVPRAVAALDEAMILFHQWVHGGWDHQRLADLDQAPTSFGFLTQEQSNVEIDTNKLPYFTDYMDTLSPAFRKLDVEDRISEGSKIALFLHTILKHSVNQPESFSKYDAFIKDFDKVLANSKFSIQTAYSLVANLRNIGLEEQLAKTRVQQILEATRGPKIILFGTTADSVVDEISIEAFCQHQRQRLQRATGTENLERVTKMWTEALPFLESDRAKASGHPEIIRTFEAFLLSFSTLRRPNYTLDVWNSLVGSGYRPTVKTWTVMLQACHIGRAYNTLQEIWRRMRRAGIKPDAHAWCAFILGLFKSGRERDGFSALEEMGREWAQEVRRTSTSTNSTTNTRKNGGRIVQNNATKPVLPPGDVNGVPKPSVVILNAAILGLHQGKHPEQIIRAITWSRQFGIEPDLVTYNTLLTVSLSRSDNAEASAILSRMSSTGISPDSETFTILLNSLFVDNALTQQPPAEQEKRIFSFIATVESSGVSIHDKSYTIIIDRLTKEARNMPLVQKVLAHMRNRGVQPSAHVYTVLMTHYFDSDPPDLRAVNELYEQIRARPRHEEVLDTIFYDRMVEGYARIGDLGSMMTFLTKMGKEGKRPGWLAMGAVVRGLAEAGDWDRVRMVVGDVKRGEGLLRAGLRGTKGQAEFWDYVSGLGLELGI
ncbi:hypothetical protein MBLNU457_2027t1 [Dothideomycetes sp. NU457]